MDQDRISSMNDTELLRELVRSRQRDSIYIKAGAAALLILTVMFIVLAAVVLPRTFATLERVDTLVEETNAMVAQANESLDNIDRMVSNVNGLVEDNTQSIEEALKGIAGIDINALNDAVKRLGDAVAPLARLFGG